jgi:phage protein D/phage baseplate assembly protein gpV
MMPSHQDVVSHIDLKVDGSDLEERVWRQVLDVTVDQHVHLPGMFAIRLYDPELKLLDEGPFDLASKVTIAAKTADNQLCELIRGEITALEPHFGDGMIAELTVRGYDLSHHLYREPKSKTYVNVKDSDVAREIVRQTQLAAEIDDTETVYEHLYQHNESDLRFLRRRARRIGYDCYVAQGKLYFRKPLMQEPQINVAWGADLLSLEPRIALSNQVRDVWVKGWDVQKKRPILGRASEGALYARIDEQDGKSWAQKLEVPGSVVTVDSPITGQAEADLLAAARLNELSAAFVQAEGTAFRRPDIQAGCAIYLDGVGKRLSGVYLVTRAVHHYSGAGLHTRFTVGRVPFGLLEELSGHEGQSVPQPGVAPAIVTNTDDPAGWGRVKVKYPWLSEQHESHWVRVAAAGGGPSCGLGAIPAVNDEVMVAFQHGDFEHPVILGGLWNGEDAPPDELLAAPTGEKPLVRTWRSRSGHHITFYDNAANKIDIVTAGGLQISLDDAKGRIALRSSGTISIEADGELKLKANTVNVDSPRINLG